MNFFKLLSFLFLTLLFSNNAFAADGKKLFTKCKACHAVDAEKHKVGPHLVGIVGRKAGSAAGYTK